MNEQNIEQISYLNSELDRIHVSQQSKAEIKKLMSKSSSHFILVKNGEVGASTANDTFSVSKNMFFSEKSTRRLREDVQYIAYLGKLEGRAIFCLDVTSINDTSYGDICLVSQFICIRKYAQESNDAYLNILLYAIGLVNWNQENQYCSRCGSANETKDSGHRMLCSMKSCGRESYPRISPAVIVLVECFCKKSKEWNLLLGRHSKLPTNMYSTLAGYVEVGESLEQAVSREIFEESGIDVENVNYIASQPWSFTSCIMIAFRATAVTSTIQIDVDELIDVRWVSQSEITRNIEGINNDYQFSRSDSIANFLIHTWAKERAETS